MFDIDKEKPVRVDDVPRVLPPRKSGRRLHVSSVYRWIQRGVRGVRLEAIKIGGTTYTSMDALKRFAEKLTSATPTRPTIITETRRSQQVRIQRAARQVQSILGTRRNQVDSMDPREPRKGADHV